MIDSLPRMRRNDREAFHISLPVDGYVHHAVSAAAALMPS
jgi:hypothetical protein